MVLRRTFQGEGVVTRHEPSDCAGYIGLAYRGYQSLLKCSTQFAIIRGDEAVADALPRSTLAPLESGKIVSAEEAVRLISDDDTIATGGFIGIGFAEEIAVAIEALHFSQEEQSVPAMSRRNLKLIYAAASLE